MKTYLRKLLILILAWALLFSCPLETLAIGLKEGEALKKVEINSQEMAPKEVTFNANGGEFQSLVGEKVQEIRLDLDRRQDLTEQVEEPVKKDASFLGWGVKSPEGYLVEVSKYEALESLEERTFYAIWGKDVIKQEGEAKPQGVPDYYVQVTVDPTERAINPERTIYYVNPHIPVSLKPSYIRGKEGHNFLKWVLRAESAPAEDKAEDYNPSNKYQFRENTSLRAIFVDDVVPQGPDQDKPPVPNMYVQVAFYPSDKARDSRARSFWVNPNKKVYLPIEDPIPASIRDRFICWRKYDSYNGYNYVDLKEKHQYTKRTEFRAKILSSAIRQPGSQKAYNIPKHYIQVVFDPTDKAQDSKKTIWWVSPGEEEVEVRVQNPTGREGGMNTKESSFLWTFNKWETIEDKISFKGFMKIGVDYSVMTLKTKNIQDGEIFKALYSRPSQNHGKAPRTEVDLIEAYKGQDSPSIKDYKEAIKLVEEDGQGNKRILSHSDYVQNIEIIKNIDTQQVARQEALLRLTYKNKARRLVKIPVKVYDLVYKAMPKSEDPSVKAFVLNNYVRVAIDYTEKAENPKKVYYYVNPNVPVRLPESDPRDNEQYHFLRWKVLEDGVEDGIEDFTLAKNHQFTKDTNITAQFVENVIEGQGQVKPDSVPDSYVSVRFNSTDKGTLEGTKVFWVNPDKKVTLPVNRPVGNQHYTFKEWKFGADAKGDAYSPSNPKQFKEATVITATYKEAPDIIPYKPDKPISRPDGYVRVTFEAEEGLSLNENKAYYVKTSSKKTLTAIKDGQGYGYPSYKEETGYTFEGWEPGETSEIKTDLVVQAKAKSLDPVIPKENPDGSENKKPTGYIAVTFVTRDKGTIKGSNKTEKTLYLNPRMGYVLRDYAPQVAANTGHEFTGWDTQINQAIVYTDGQVITALYNDYGHVEEVEKPGYVKVEYKEGDHGSLEGTTNYWVKPGVSINIPDPTVKANTGFAFENWDQATQNVTLNDPSQTYTIRAGYRALNPIIPAKDSQGKDNDKPAGYVTLTFNKGTHGDLEGEAIFYVNPGAGKTLGNIAPKPTIKPETGFKANGWDAKDDLEITKDVTVTAQYSPLDDVIPKEKPTGGENDRPAGYIVVTFDKRANGSLEGNTVFYVNPNKAVVLQDKNPPMIKPNTGFEAAGWDTSINKAIKYTDGDKITALYNPLKDVIPGDKTKPAGYLEVNFDKGLYGNLTGTTKYWVKPNTSFSLPEPDVKPNIGYVFNEWDKSTKNISLSAQNSPYTITAGYKLLEDIIPGDQAKPEGYVEVRFMADGHGTLSGTTLYYVNPEKEVDLRTQAEGISKNPKAGYSPDGGTWTPKLESIKYTENTTHTFNFKELEAVLDKPSPGYVKVDFIAGPKGSLEGGNKTYYVNPDKNVRPGSQDLPIPNPSPDKNYGFDKWTPDPTSSGPIKDSTIFIAYFKAKQVTLTYDGNGATEGTVPEAMTYPLGRKVTLAGGRDLKKDNYVLRGWEIDGKPYKPGETFTINSDTTATAIWEESFHKVDFNTGGATYIPSQDVKHGTSISPVNPPEKPESKPQPKPEPDRPSYPGGSSHTWILPGPDLSKDKLGTASLRREVKYMQGYDGYFRPSDGITRAEAAQILANALNEDGYGHDQDYQLKYKDTKDEKWYTEAIKTTSQAGVFWGYEDGYFRPERKISRTEWIATLRRFQEIGLHQGNAMKLRKNHWAMGEVQGAYVEGWLDIYTKGLADFKPDETIPRQEVAALSNKAFRRVLDRSYIKAHEDELINYKDIDGSMWAYEDILCASNTFLHDVNNYKAYRKRDGSYSINIDGYKIVQDLFQRIPRK